MILSPRFDPIAGRFGKVKPKPSVAHHSRLSCILKVTQTTNSKECYAPGAYPFDVVVKVIRNRLFFFFFD
ncbi:hypothetical protein ACHMW5_01965 (plasmid) [Azospirillum melinis]|uniref:hypothetical protein n=1 Tax=Azospirillum melinis TaxID=328839 RepID=UPI003756BF28